MMRKISIILLAAAMSLVVMNCQKKAQVEGVSLEASFSEETLTDNLITEMHYQWKTDSNFAGMSKNYMVFVHFWHEENMLFQDDHLTEVSTSKWEPGKEYSYTRRIYIPSFIDEFDPQFKGMEELKLVIGLYSPYDRAGKSKSEILTKKLKISLPPLDTPEIIYEDGWYDEEINTESFLKRWRWTAKEARCIIDNPHRDALLVMKGGVNLEALDDQKVIFKINDLILDEFIPEESSFEKSYQIKKEMVGDEDEFYLVIGTNKIFVPKKVYPDSQDERVLGIQISFIYFR
jgi:hypothetical protein